MGKFEALESIRRTGVVAAIRAKSSDEGMRLVEAVKAGGITAVEITMTVPGALDIIKTLAQKYGDLMVGTGTVLDPETARSCVLAGAKYIVSPALNLDTLKLCTATACYSSPG